VVFLTVSPDSVADRIRTAIFEERRHWYEEVASATFDTSRRPMQKIADEIATWRREQR
jgi:shikimate kinase